MANPYLKFNNKTVRVGSDGGRLISPFEPIPPYTLRVEFVNTPECQSAGFDPTQGTGDESAPDWSYGTWRHVYGNVYDWTYPSDTWLVQYKNPRGTGYASPWGLTRNGQADYTNRFQTLAYRVVGANLTGVKYIPKLFTFTAKYLVSVALFDTSMIECAGSMFSTTGQNIPQYLTSLPDFDFSGIDNESVPLGQTTAWAVNYSIQGLMYFCNNERVLTATPNLVFPSSRSINTKNMYYSCDALTSATLNGLQSSDAGSMFYGCTSLASASLSNCNLVSPAKMFMVSSSATYSIPTLGMTNVSVSGNASNMFANCKSLTSVPLFDTSAVTTMNGMFSTCHSLTTVPLLDTSSATNMQDMFHSCYNVESGALSLYQQASTQDTPPVSYRYCFTNCGRDTVTGAAELAQIPTDWGGTYTPPSE